MPKVLKVVRVVGDIQVEVWEPTVRVTEDGMRRLTERGDIRFTEAE